MITYDINCLISLRIYPYDECWHFIAESISRNRGNASSLRRHLPHPYTIFVSFNFLQGLRTLQIGFASSSSPLVARSHRQASALYQGVNVFLRAQNDPAQRVTSKADDRTLTFESQLGIFPQTSELYNIPSTDLEAFLLPDHPLNQKQSWHSMTKLQYRSRGKKGPFPVSYSLLSAFEQLTVKYILYKKVPLYQLSYNHCHLLPL